MGVQNKTINGQEKLKAWLVVCGFQQKKWINFENILAPLSNG
jgi:hypothetical protein